MKKISLLLVGSLLMQSLAWAGPKESLKSVLDEYRYAVTVEWDQKDQAQLEQLKANFSQELKKIVQEEKLSAQDLQAFVQENSQELQVSKNVLETIKDSSGELSLEKAQKMLESKSELFYAQGSSWHPNNSLYYSLGVLAVFEIVVLILNIKDDKCPNPNDHANDIPYNCRYEN